MVHNGQQQRQLIGKLSVDNDSSRKKGCHQEKP